MRRFSVSLLLLFVSCSPSLLCAALPLDKLKLPANYQIDLFASNVPDARQMSVAPNGIIALGSRTAGKVYLLLPNKSMTSVQDIMTVDSGLTLPNGVAWHNDDLYVATQTDIRRYPSLLKTLEKHSNPQIIIKDIPSIGHHGWHVIKFGADNKLYIGIGAPCNVCLSKDKRLASIARMNPDGSQFEVIAHGVRNTVGFDWHPTTHELWFADNGRDWMGDDMPPDEINRIKNYGQHYGFPYVYGDDILDPDFGKVMPKRKYIPPVLNLQAHVAPLGMHFYTGSVFQHGLYVAKHGSWNRRKKVGYKVTYMQISNNKVITQKDFITGWLKDEKFWGRPVDIVQYIDGSLLISDDFAGAIYKVTHTRKNNKH